MITHLAPKTGLIVVINKEIIAKKSDEYIPVIKDEIYQKKKETFINRILNYGFEDSEIKTKEVVRIYEEVFR